MKRIWRANGCAMYIGGDLLIVATDDKERQELFDKFVKENSWVESPETWEFEEVTLSTSQVIVVNRGDY
jgi:hypothetical protein